MKNETLGIDITLKLSALKWLIFRGIFPKETIKDRRINLEKQFPLPFYAS